MKIFLFSFYFFSIFILADPQESVQKIYNSPKYQKSIGIDRKNLFPNEAIPEIQDNDEPEYLEDSFEKERNDESSKTSEDGPANFNSNPRKNPNRSTFNRQTNKISTDKTNTTIQTDKTRYNRYQSNPQRNNINNNQNQDTTQDNTNNRQNLNNKGNLSKKTNDTLNQNSNQNNLREPNSSNNPNYTQSPSSSNMPTPKELTPRNFSSPPILTSYFSNIVLTIFKILVWGISAILGIFLILAVLNWWLKLRKNYKNNALKKPELNSFHSNESIEPSLNDLEFIVNERRYLDACRLLFQKSISILQEKKLLSFKNQHLTNNEMIWYIQDPILQENIQVFNQTIERGYYACQPIEEQDYQKCQNSWQKILSCLPK